MLYIITGTIIASLATLHFIRERMRKEYKVKISILSYSFLGLLFIFLMISTSGDRIFPSGTFLYEIPAHFELIVVILGVYALIFGYLLKKYPNKFYTLLNKNNE